jgi:RNA polymerase sigma-70 factor, ECF subfamily
MSLLMTDDARDAQAALAARNDSAAAPSGKTSGAGEPHEGHLAFARIYDRHSAVVRALCVRHLPTDTDADDALQETFIRAYRLLHEAQGSESLRPWLYAIARLVCAERRRAAARRNKHEQAAAQERIVMNGLSSTNHTIAGRRSEPTPAPAEHAEALSRLTVALDELPDEERLAIHLYYLETDPVSAAGSALGISRSGFYKLLARAREHLASALGSVAP